MEVDDAITRLIAARECGVIDDPQTGGIGFVSDAIATLRDQRERYQPSGPEIAAQRTKVLQEVFRDGISTSLHSTKTINAGIRYGRSGVIIDGDEAGFRLEAADSTVVLERRAGLLVDTNSADWRTLVAWLFAASAEVDDLLAEIVRSEKIIREKGGVEADRDVAQFVRSERNRQDSDRERAQRLLEEALLGGTFIFEGVATPVRERGASVVAAARAALSDAAGHLFDKHSLAPFRASTDLAVRFLQADDLRRMPKESDPLGLVRTIGGSARVDTDSPVLSEVLRVFEQKVRDSGAGRLQGNAIQDLFLAPPYGWTKDTTRYLFAALFRAGEVELFTPGGLLKTVGPQAREVFRSTLEFGRVGVARRDTKPDPEALDRAAEALKKILGEDVLPLEDRIAEAVRTGMPAVTERVASLPERLRLLGLAGVERAQQIHRDCTDLLAGDAGDAAARLGQRDSTLERDIRWAEATVRVLGEGAEDDVRRASHTLADLDDIFLLDRPAGAELRIDTELAAVKDHLAAESLFEQVAALRTDLRKIDGAIEKALADAVNKLGQQLASIRSRLEAMPQWVRLGDDDRAEIVERLAAPREALAAAAGRRRRDIGPFWGFSPGCRSWRRIWPARSARGRRRRQPSWDASRTFGRPSSSHTPCFVRSPWIRGSPESVSEPPSTSHRRTRSASRITTHELRPEDPERSRQDGRRCPSDPSRRHRGATPGQLRAPARWLRVLGVEELVHLGPEGQELAGELRAWQAHLAASATEPTEQGRRTAAFRRMAHEAAFTTLNRLAAIRMAEERDLVIESVRKGPASDGFRLFERLSGASLGDRDDAYAEYLGLLFDELAVELGVLFERHTPAGRLFPRPAALSSVLELLDAPQIAPLWAEDETIGWIYQYFNSKEERDAMRKASAAPRNSRELAVRNQYFTPRYVVEFLTDNTLGRIWYEMRRGDTRLVGECPYLVAAHARSSKARVVGVHETVHAGRVRAGHPAGHRCSSRIDRRRTHAICVSLILRSAAVTSCFAHTTSSRSSTRKRGRDPDRRICRSNSRPRLRDDRGLAQGPSRDDPPAQPARDRYRSSSQPDRCPRSLASCSALVSTPESAPSERPVDSSVEHSHGGTDAGRDRLDARIRGGAAPARARRSRARSLGEDATRRRGRIAAPDRCGTPGRNCCSGRQWQGQPHDEQLALFGEPRPRAEPLAGFDVSGISDERVLEQAEARVLVALTSTRRRALSRGATSASPFRRRCRRRVRVHRIVSASV